MSDLERSAVNRRLKRLVDAAIDGTATGDELQELDAALQDNAAARCYYGRVAEVHASLRWIHRAETAVRETLPPLAPAFDALGDAAPLLERGAASLSSPSLAATIGGDERDQSARRSGPGGVTAAARFARSAGAGRSAAAAVICGLAAALVGVIAYRNVIVQQREARDVAVETVAQLDSDRDCVWIGAADGLTAGQKLVSGQRLELAKGAAKLLFRQGAAVVLEGPAEVELISASSMRLVHGTIAVRVNGPHKKFVVASADASIVDLGTSFGVHRSPQGATEVEVFEGAVEVFPEGGQSDSRVLGVGAAALVRGEGREDGEQTIDMTASATDRFGDLLELLWENMVSDVEDDASRGERGVVYAGFVDGPAPGAVDTFYGSAPGRGWLTPWVAAGNPTGEIARAFPLSGGDDPYLGVRFYNSLERCIARQYGPRRGFDPNQPHVISWRWRFDGNLDHFQGQFLDRIAFYGNPFFRRNSWPTNSWLIGVVSDHENRWQSPKGKNRQVLPLRWYAFNGGEGEEGEEFVRENMVDTGMSLKAGVVYRFAVVVYPEEARYDFAIRDDEQTFARTGLKFRDREAGAANVLHFSVSANDRSDDLSFSVGSIRIEPLRDEDVQHRVAGERVPDSSLDSLDSIDDE